MSMTNDAGMTEETLTPQSSRARQTFWGVVLLAVIFLAAAGLSVEAWMQLYAGRSLCSTSACEVVGEFVRIGEAGLVVTGAVFFWLVWAVVFFARRYPQPWLWGSATLLVCGALAFDGGLLGYQFMGLGEQCLLCLAVGLSLGLVTALLARVRGSWLLLFLGLAVWTGGFAANSVLRIDPDSPPVAETAFLESAGDASKAPLRLHLFFSLHCGHCSELAANLAVNQAWQKAYWTLSATDSAERDLRRLAAIQRDGDAASNPFVSILRVESQKEVPKGPVPEAIRRATHKTQVFFRHRRWRGVPVLLAQEGLGKKVVLTGKEHIMRYLARQDILTRRIDMHKLRENLPRPPEP